MFGKIEKKGGMLRPAIPHPCVILRLALGTAQLNDRQRFLCEMLSEAETFRENVKWSLSDSRNELT